MKRFWMPLNIGDCLAETGHLTVAEIGAYLLLQMYYWSKSGLPKDEVAIRRISKMTTRQWSQSRDVLKAFFEDDWRHVRLDEEISKAVDKSTKNSANARLSHAGRKNFASPPQPEPLGQQQIKLESLPSGERDTPSLKSPQYSGEKTVPRKLDPNWRPGEKDLQAAGGFGMSQPDIESELTKFKAHHAEKGTSSHSWSASWVMWCSRWNGKPVPTTPAIAKEVRSAPMVHIKSDTEQWKAWQSYKKRVNDRGTPIDKQFGWHFESEWPPGQLQGEDEEVAAQSDS